MDARFDALVLIIKTAWGAKSLYTHFPSPSAGPYRLMIEHVRKVLADPKQVIPGYYFLDSKHKDHPNAEGSMTEQQKGDYFAIVEAIRHK